MRHEVAELINRNFLMKKKTLMKNLFQTTVSSIAVETQNSKPNCKWTLPKVRILRYMWRILQQFNLSINT